jgi:hypothetical protein
VTLEEQIAAFEAQLSDRSCSVSDLEAAEVELRLVLVEAVLPVLPGLCSDIRGRRGLRGDGWTLWADGILEAQTALPSPGELARVLANVLDRQLQGSMPATTAARRAQAALLRAVAGAVHGMRDIFRR